MFLHYTHSYFIKVNCENEVINIWFVQVDVELNNLYNLLY